MIILQLISNCTLKRNTIRHYIENSLGSIKQFIEASLSIYVTIINIILIVICNCSLLNPGPSTTPVKDSNLKVFYQNVHGFLTYSSLGSKNPVLNITKVFEFQPYIASHQPDIVVLNETWLKASINDAEIFPNNDYKTFRLDRSPDSRPPDPNNSKKFRRNGGGVLIAVNSSVDMKPKVLKTNTKAEILSITLQLKNNKKICVTTCYRVGTLGEANLSEISKHIQLVSTTKSIICHTIIGDMNLDTVNWEESSSSTPLHKEFLTIFANHNLSQLITFPTHYLGNTLDILLSNVPSAVSNIKICDHNEYVKSDHFAITFDIIFSKLISRNKGSKRTIRNYKKANWRDINNALRTIN